MDHKVVTIPTRFLDKNSPELTQIREDYRRDSALSEQGVLINDVVQAERAARLKQQTSAAIDQTDLDRKVEKAVSELSSQGYTIQSITPITS